MKRPSFGYRILALVLSTTLMVSVVPASIALGDDASTTPVTTTTSDTSTSATTTDSSTQSSDAATSTDASNSVDATTTSVDDLTIHASTTQPVILATSTDSAEIVNGDASSTSTPGFQTVTPIGPDATTSGDSGSPGDPAVASSSQTIQTGTAVTFANILNILNTLFLNSTGAILFANFTDPTGSIDLRDPTDLSGLCDGNPCSGLHGVTLNLLLDGKIQNDIMLSANTGSNAIANASSSAAIATGDAMAGLNLVNIANVTFADSKYLLLTLNAFRGVNGDIIFPSLYDFFGALGDGSGPGNINVNQSANVDNNVGVGAGSGSNTTSNVDGASTILTGSADSRANVYNDLNGLFSGSGLSVLLRVGPDWNGQIFGLPDGVTAQRIGDSVLISGAGNPNFAPALDVNATSTVDIGNRVQVQALTGDNSITDASSSALIMTGNAFAGANIINIANQTVIGRNWLLAVLNIFGNFNGNISFGRPDLWVGDQADAPSVIQDGSEITYTMTVKNRGDAVAHNVLLHELPDPSLTIESSSQPYTASDGGLVFDLGTLNPGASAHVSYVALVPHTPSGVLKNTTTASATEPDNNLADNTDGTSLSSRIVLGGGVGIGQPAPTMHVIADAGSAPLSGAADPADPVSGTLTVTRTTPTATASPSASVVHESVTVANDTNTMASGIVLHDILRDPSGVVVHSDDWNIGSLTAGDGVQIQYDFNFAPGAPSGTYTLTTEISGDNVKPTSYGNGTIQFEGPVSTFTLADPNTQNPTMQTGTSQLGQVLRQTQLPVSTFHPTTSGIMTPQAPDTRSAPRIPDTGGATSPQMYMAAAGVGSSDDSSRFVLIIPLIAMIGVLYSTRKRYL